MSKKTTKRLARSGQPRTRLHVLGAAGGVTGSLNLFEYFNGNTVIRFLLEVGLHQEFESLNHQNRLPRGITPADIDFAIISHAHIDHSGYLPKLVKDGFKGPVYTHAATRDLLEIMLPDSGYLQEEEANRINRRLRREAKKKSAASRKGGNGKNSGGKSGAAKGKVEPLYTEEDARRSLAQIKPLNYGNFNRVADGVTVRFTEASHILGAAVVTVDIGKGGHKKRFCFTGNIGRPGTPLLKPLSAVRQADYVMSESTYGDRLHKKRDRLEALAGIINRAYERASDPHLKYGHGVILIPAFAVGRAQTVLYDLRELMKDGKIPNIPVFLDSPMAIRATAVHRKYAELGLLNRKATKLVGSGVDLFSPPRFMECMDRQHSERLDEPASEPIIIVGSSGMASGGRIVQHLYHRLPGKQHTVVFVGYQGTGTFGQNLTNLKSGRIRMFGEELRVNATIEFMPDYSGHADYNQILAWLGKFNSKPRNIFLVHGDEEALTSLAGQIESRLDWKVTIPKRREIFEL